MLRAAVGAPASVRPVHVEFDHEQELLRRNLRRLLDDRAPLAWVRDRLDDAVGTTPEVHAALADLGVFGLAVPEGHGGAGRGMVDLAVVLEETGRSVYPGPLRSIAVGGVGLLTLAADDGVAARLLPDVAAGNLRAVPALYTTGPAARSGGGMRAVPAGGGWRLEGCCHPVPDAAAADVLLVAATRPDHTAGCFALDPGAPGVTLEPVASVDGTSKAATLRCTGASAEPCGAGDAREAIAAVRDRLVVADVLDGLGAAEAALAIAVEHAKTRRQFGRPIGSFQAVAHLAADMLRAVELARVAAYYAAWATDVADARERHRAATMALATATEGLYRVGADCIQILGGIGFTWEHDAHLFYKRLLTLQQHPAGGRLTQLEELARLALAAS